MPQSEVLVFLVEDFEEEDLATCIIGLRKAGERVTTVSLKRGPVWGSHGLAFLPDKSLYDIDDGPFKAFILPGSVYSLRILFADPRFTACLIKQSTEIGIISLGRPEDILEKYVSEFRDSHQTHVMSKGDRSIRSFTQLVLTLLSGN